MNDNHLARYGYILLCLQVNVTAAREFNIVVYGQY
jgi:hypothetical protein